MSLNSTNSMDVILAPDCKQNQFLQFESSVKNEATSKNTPSELIINMRSVRKGGEKTLNEGQQSRLIRCRYIIRSF